MTISGLKQLEIIGDKQTCPVVAIIQNGLILIGHRHYTPDKWKSISVWTLPGGRCEGDEKLETTLRREVLEETGIDDLTFTHFIGEVPGSKKGDIVYIFVGTSTKEPQLLEPEKFSEWKWENPANITISKQLSCQSI